MIDAELTREEEIRDRIAVDCVYVYGLGYIRKEHLEEPKTDQENND
jgi:hypothetical protein